MAVLKLLRPGIHTLSNIMSHNVSGYCNGNLTGWLAVGSTASFGQMYRLVEHSLMMT